MQLLYYGADVRSGMPATGDTPLHLACTHKHVRMAGLLLERERGWNRGHVLNGIQACCGYMHFLTLLYEYNILYCTSPYLLTVSIPHQMAPTLSSPT